MNIKYIENLSRLPYFFYFIYLFLLLLDNILLNYHFMIKCLEIHILYLRSHKNDAYGACICLCSSRLLQKALRMRLFVAVLFHLHQHVSDHQKCT